MSRFDSFLIFINNLSYVYIFTTISVIVSIFLACCAKVVNSVPKNKNKQYPTVQSENNIDDDDADEIIQQNVTNGLLGQIKSSKYKEIEKGLSKDEIEQEKNVEREQLAAIFKLLKAQEVEFNTNEIDENQLKKQLKLYR